VNNDTTTTAPAGSLWQRFWDSGAWVPALFVVVLFAWLSYLKWSK
jgi:hypothetical protein